jgi:hypothetical protein
MYVVNDSGTGLSTGGNSQCTVFRSGASVASVGAATLTVTLDLMFDPRFSGNRVVYMAYQGNGQNTGWQPAGTVTIQ